MIRPAEILIALRSLRARKAYAVVTLSTIMLIVGAGSAILAVINATFLRPLPFQDETALVWIYSHPPGTAGTSRRNPLHPPTFVAMREHLRVTPDFAGSWSRERAVRLGEGAETVDSAGVSSNFFDVLGITPASGRTFTADEDRADARVALVSDTFWRTRLGGSDVRQQPLVIDGIAHDVIGILPATTPNGFLSADVYTPLAMYAGNVPNPNATLVTGLARVPQGISPAQVQADLDNAMAEVVQARPDVMKGWTASMMPVREALFGDLRPVLLMLAAAIVLLGAIASVNLATVTIGEMVSRRGEFSLRAALGAARTQLVRLILVEHVLLSMAGGLGGLLLAALSLPLVLSLDAGTAARLGEVAIDWRVQLGAFALALIVGVLSGVLPTLLSTRGDLANALASSGRRSSGGRQQTRMRLWLVASETALAVVLLVASALLLGAFRLTLDASPGFDPTNILGAQIRLPTTTYPGVPERAEFVRRLLDEMRAVPGVAAASATFNTFQGGSFNTSISVEGRPTADGRPHTVQFRRAAPGYFDLMKIPEVQGRTFSDKDDLNGMLVAVVSKSFVDAVLGGGEPIGQRLVRAADPTRPVTIIGVVGDVRDGGLASDPGPMLYLPYSQNNNAAAAISLVVKTAGEPAAMQRSVAAALHRIDSTLPLSNPTTLTAFLEESVGPTRFRSVLLTVLSACGLLLAIVGIVGVTSRGITERTRELGVRLALGSTRVQVWSSVVRRAMFAVVLGLAAAIPFAFVAARLMAQSIPGVAAVSWWVAVPAALVLLAGGTLAAAIPAIRAARLDPIRALRAD